MKKRLVLAIALCTILALSATTFAACKKRAPGISLDRESLTLEAGGVYALTPTVTNYDGEIEWTSLSPSVASVSDGEVAALSVGTAVIRAAAGKASAQCTVTVIAPSEVGTLVPGYTEIDLLEGRQITVSPKLTYKGTQIDGINFTFAENSGGGVIALENTTSSATVIKAIAAGNAAVTVSCTHFGILLAETIPVTVKKDAAIEVTNLHGELNLVKYVPAGYEAQYINEFLPEVEVIVNGVLQTGDFVLRIPQAAQSGIVTLSGKNIIGAGVGSTVVELVYTASDSNEYVYPIPVIVGLAEVQEEIVFDLEQASGSGEIVSAFLTGSVTKVKLNGTQVSFAEETGKVTVSGFSALATGEHSLLIECDNLVYSAKALLITKIIRNAADLDAMEALSGKGSKVWDGYFVLGNDIEYNKTYVNVVGLLGWDDNNSDEGFRGTFDGRGHIIKGFGITGQPLHALFGTLAKTGVVKNVGFTNANIAGNSAAVVAARVYGTIENVFVDVAIGTGYWLGGLAGFGVFPGGIIRNCVVAVTAVSGVGDGRYALTNSASGAQIDHIYSVGARPLYGIGEWVDDTGAESATLKNFATFAAMKSAGLDLASWNTDIWDISGGTPVFRAYVPILQASAAVSAITNNTAVLVDGTLTITGSSDYIYSLKSDTPTGITINGNIVTVTIPDNMGASFTVVATHILTNSVFVEKTFTVISKSSQNLSGYKFDVDMSGSNALTISELSGKTLVGVTIGGVAVTSSLSGTTLTLSGFGGIALGQRAMVIETDTAYYNLSVLMVTKIIRNAADLDAMGGLAHVNNYVWDGYFILGGDIDYNGVWASFCGVVLDDWCWDETNGFRGTFDGRGYVINGLVINVMYGGLIEVLAEGGVIKNVGFTNAQLNGASYAGIASSCVYGMIENVFVEVQFINALCSGGIAFQPLWGVGIIRYCVAYVTGASGGSANNAVSALILAGATVEHSYSVGSLAVAPAETATLKNFATFAAMKTGGVNLTGWNTDIWDVAGGAPVFKGYKQYVSDTKNSRAITNNNAAPVVDTLTVTGSGEWVYSIKEAISGISISGNVVTVTGNPGASFTVAAAYLFDSSITAEKVFTVASKSSQNLSGYKFDVDMSGSNALTISELSGKTLVGVTIGGVTVTSSLSGTTLTLSGFGGVAAGQRTMIIETDAEYYNLSVLMVTKIIRSAADLDAMEVLSNKGGNVWDGYFILGNDIAYNGVFTEVVGQSSWYDFTLNEGFIGTFDGRGYVIEGLVISGTLKGLFGTLGQAGIVKNVGFIGAQLGGGSGSGIVAARVFGLIENIYIEVAIVGEEWWSGAVAGFSALSTARIRNCVIITDTTLFADSPVYPLVNSIQQGASLDHCYSVGALPLYSTDEWDYGLGAETATLKNFATLTDMESAGLDLSGWDEDIWDVTSGIPVFKGVIA